MTDITKRLAEPMSDGQIAYERAFPKEQRVPFGLIPDWMQNQWHRKADFDRTAAQEANVQGGEFTAICDQCGQANASWAGACGRCGINMAFHTAAPHPTPAPASGEVTEALVEICCKEAYSACDMGPWPDMAAVPASDRRFVRAALEAAARARQGECSCPQHGDWIAADDVNRLVRDLDVAINGEAGAAKQASLCDIVAQMKRRGGVWMWVADRFVNRVHALVISAPNAADAEAIAWPDVLTVEDFHILRALHVFITSREKMHPDGVALYDDIIKRFQDAFDALIPTAAPAAPATGEPK